MNSINGLMASPSYFWSCITFTDDCPFFSNLDPNLLYFGICLLCFYSAFVLVILADLNFYWPVNKLQNQIDYLINLVKSKLKRVEMNQRRLVSVQERTEKQLKKSEQCQRIVNTIRGALDGNDSEQLSILASTDLDNLNNSPARRATWSECHSINDL